MRGTVTEEMYSTCYTPPSEIQVRFTAKRSAIDIAIESPNGKECIRLTKDQARAFIQLIQVCLDNCK